jgi:hypothetical protein
MDSKGNLNVNTSPPSLGSERLAVARRLNSYGLYRASHAAIFTKHILALLPSGEQAANATKGTRVHEGMLWYRASCTFVSFVVDEIKKPRP